MKILPLVFLFFTPIVLLAQDQFEAYNLEELDSIYKQEKVPKKKLVYVFAMLKKAEKEYGTQDTSYAEVLRKVGSTYLNINIDSSITYTKKALKIQEVKIPNHPDYAKSLNNLGIAYYYRNDLEKTEKYWLQASAIRKKVLGEKHISYLGSLVNLGNLFMDLGNYEKAINNYSLAKKLFEKQNLITHQFYFICLNNLAIVHEKIAAYEKAEDFYLQTLKFQKKKHGEEHPDYLVTLGYLASLYNIMNNYEQAENLLLRVLELKKKVLGEQHYSYGSTLNSLGNLYAAKQNYQKAEKFYLKDLNVTKKVSGEQSTGYASSLGNIGILYLKMKAYKKAEQYQLQALEIRKKSLGKQHPSYADNLTHLGNLYASMERYEETEVLYLEAYDIRKNVFNSKHEDILLSLNNLAAIYSDLNQFDLAWEYVLRSIHSNTNLSLSKKIDLNWTKNILNANHISLGRMNTSLSIIFGLLSKQTLPNSRKQQILVSDLALELLRKKKNGFYAENDKLRILSESADWVIRSMEILDKEKDAAKAFNLTEQNKSVLLLEAASNKRAYGLGSLPDSIVEEEKALEKAYASTKAALVENSTTQQQDSIQNAFMELNIKIDAFQDKIKQKYPKYAATKYQYAPVQATEIQSLLDDKTAILEYLIGDSIIYAFYIDQSQIKVHEFAVDNELLKNKIYTLHKVLSSYDFLKNNKLSYRRYTNQAYWFYKNLVAPSLTNNTHIKQLVIVTDGELAHLPFEAFLMEQAPQEVTNYNQLHYLIQDYRISYNYSATLWKENQSIKNRQNNGQILGFAANYKELDSTSTILRSPSDRRVRDALGPLAAARKEVEALSQHFNGFFAFDSIASERLFKEKASDFSVIHLAMHGILNEQNPLLSSLAFTEDMDSTENNFLHAYEISKMELNADLVVLSACETGFGKFERGNGIASLARSFMYAGAPAMIVSLWQVNDYTTSAIMRSLYYNLGNGMKKDEALRQAKLFYINNAGGVTGHPSYWSPFILIGNESPTTITRKGTWIPWIIGSSILIFLLGSFFFLKRKKELQ